MIISDLIDARILAELRRQGTFAGAARALRLPSTTVSRRVARMEERAGLRFYERTSRSVRITEAGEVAALHAEEMLEQANAAELTLDRLREKPAGCVAVSTPVIFGQAILAPVVATFLADYPACRLEVDLSDRHIDLIEDRFDVVVRVGPPADDRLIAKPVGVVFAGLYAAPDAPVPTCPEGLAHHPLGLLHPGTGQIPALTLATHGGRERTVDLAPRLVSMNPWLLMDVAVAGEMVVVLPDIVAAPAIEAGRLVRVLPDWHARRAPVHLAFTSRRLMRPAVRAFVDHAAVAIPDQLRRLR